MLISLLAGKPNRKIAKRRRPRPCRGYPQTETVSAGTIGGKGPGIPGFSGNRFGRPQRPRLVGGAGSLERICLCGRASPKTIIRERLSGSCLQIVLKLLSPALLGKRVIADQFPRFISRSTTRPTWNVGCNTLLQIRGETDVSLIRKRLTPDELHIEHRRLHVPAFLRQGFGGQPCSNLAPSGLLA